jgi:sulfotransferase family protein
MPAGARWLAYLFRQRDRRIAPFRRAAAIRAVRAYQRDRWRYSLRRRRAAVDRIALDRPIFVLGLQGGGTTLVARCLLRHRDVVSMGGNSDFWVATDELGFVRNRMARLPPSLWSSAHRSDLDHPVFGTDHASVYACDELLPHYRRAREDATPADAEAYTRLLREHIAVYAHEPGRARFVDKTHTNTVKVPYLDELLEGCRPFFLLVLRNPYTHCFRALRRKPPSWRTAVPYEEQLRIAAEHWRNSFALALEDGPSTGRFAAVRFEDFVARPETIVRAICAAVELPYDPELVPRAGHAMPFGTLESDRKWFPLTDDPWRGRIGDHEAALIEDVCGPLSEKLGYGRLEDRRPGAPEVLTAA